MTKFFLLKSEIDRDYVGDVLINVDRISSISIIKHDRYYILIVRTFDDNPFIGQYKTLDSAKKAIKILQTDELVSDEEFFDLKAQIEEEHGHGKRYTQ